VCGDGRRRKEQQTASGRRGELPSNQASSLRYPLSWFLHKRIVRVAEDASDDAAVAVIRNRALYAEVLLDFFQRGLRGSNWLGVSMARYGRPDERINRILDGTALSRGVTRWSVAAILALGSPLAFFVAAADPQNTSQAQTATVAASRSARAGPVKLEVAAPGAPTPPTRFQGARLTRTDRLNARGKSGLVSRPHW
jgi:hypothetical protein